MEKLRQWQKVKEIIGAALERPLEERTAFLNEVCSPDAELRSEVDSLLAAYGGSEDLSASPWTHKLGEQENQPTLIGPYRLVKELGVGGMGQVWLAEQNEPVKRQVALKLIRAGMYDASAVQRFKTERQSLAIMDHPAIAKVFDAGTTAAAQPYFVMEYVDGLPITDYCDLRKLTIGDRLKLFARVCDGVQHAHQKAIIHRDLKPPNILVVEVDGKPMPRIIDFGLAKATVPPLAGETLLTQIGAFLGTPGYMSPEQADPNVSDIDTRTDVYSLGVILYELLTGFLPFDTKEWKQRPEEFLRRLREDDPPRPSTKINTNRESSAAHAGARSTEPKQLASLLRGDLDWIVMKAIEKDRERRYAMPSTLAVDIENYQQNRPVTARPASLGYRIRKYVRRHRVGVAVISGAVLFLIVFAGMQAVEVRRVTRERDRADRVTEFMTSMFTVSDPSEARGNTITAREILDKSSKEIDTSLAREPELRAEMLTVMGTVYHKLGLYSRAETLLRAAVQTRRSVLGPGHPETLKTSAQWALTLEAAGHYTEAEKLMRELLSTEQRVLGTENRATLATMSNLFWTLDSEAREQEAESIGRKTLEIQERVLGKNDPDTVLSMRRLASVLNSAGHYTEAEALYRENLEISRRVLGLEHPETLATMGDLGLVLLREGRNAEAEALLRQTLQLQRRVLGPEHENTFATMNSLGNVLSNEHRLTEAENLYREGAAIASRSLGKEHRYTLAMLSNVASTMQDQGRYREAEKLDRDMLATRRRILGPGHPDTAIAIFNLADVLRAERRYAEAEALFREAIDVDRRALGPDHPDTIDSLYNLACTLAQERDSDQALAILSRAVDAGLPAEDAAKIDSDAAFKLLRNNPKFLALVSQAKRATPAHTQD